MPPCGSLGGRTTLTLPQNPLVCSPQPPGAVTVVTASGGDSPWFHCCGPGGRGGCAPCCLENAKTHSSKMGLSLVPLLLPPHEAKGTPSWWMWGPRGSGIAARTLQGPLRKPWRNRPRVRRIPQVSSGKTEGRTGTHPARLPTPDSRRLLQAGETEAQGPLQGLTVSKGQRTTRESTLDLPES